MSLCACGGESSPFANSNSIFWQRDIKCSLNNYHSKKREAIQHLLKYFRLLSEQWNVNNVFLSKDSYSVLGIGNIFVINE